MTDHLFWFSTFIPPAHPYPQIGHPLQFRRVVSDGCNITGATGTVITAESYITHSFPSNKLVSIRKWPISIGMILGSTWGLQSYSDALRTFLRPPMVAQSPPARIIPPKTTWAGPRRSPKKTIPKTTPYSGRVL